MTIVRGFAIATGFSDRVDHTYVASEDGDVWGCGGRSSGGVEICTGPGRIDVSRCIAGPDGLAWMRYARQGVCHQWANRLLRPAGVRVEAACGYKFSSMMYGHYGLGGDWWWKRCCILCRAEDLLAEGPRPPELPGLKEARKEFVPAPSDRDQHIGACIERFREIVRAVPDEMPSATVARADEAVAEMAGRQFDLIGAHERGEIGSAQFYDTFVETTKAGYARVEGELGEERFVRLFGAPPEAVAELFDPEAFMRSEAARSGS